MRNIDEAKKLLNGEVKCAVFYGEETFLSDKRGIAPILSLVCDGKDYKGCIAADKIVGKAAAFVYSKMGAKEIYAEVLSEAAIPVLERHSVKYSFGKLTDYIRNRQGDGICPMEQTVKDIEDVDLAIEALKKKVDSLRRGDK